MALKGAFWVATGLAGIILLALIAAFLGRSSDKWCNLATNAGDCKVYNNGECYCIDTFGADSDTNHTDTKELGLYQHSVDRCLALRGILACSDQSELVIWLSKRMFQMGVNTAVVGLRKMGPVWFWTCGDDEFEAKNIEWRADFPPDQTHTHAVITVESVRILKDYYYGVQYLNYEYYLDRDRGYQWYGFTTTDDVFTKDAFYICRYTQESLLKIKLDEEEETNVNPVQKSSDKCSCSADERVELSTTSDSATFQTPGYPRNYCNDGNCRWIITISEEYAIQLEWLAFSTEHQMDFVYVYDGESDDSPLLATCSGWMCTSQRSSSNAMQVHFHSDHVTTDLGFKAKVVGVKNDECFCSESMTVSLVNLYETVNILSPRYPHAYCANHQCGWTIVTQENYGLQLRWNAFDTLQDAHTATMYDGDIIAQQCSGVTCDDLITTGHMLRVEFVTDAMPTEHIGFQATITVINNYCERHPMLSDGSISYSAERDDGIPAGANATFRCGKDRKIQDTDDQTSLVLMCQPPKWTHDLPTCIPVCHIQFPEMIDLHDIHFCMIPNGVSMVPVGQTVAFERFDLINQLTIAADDLTCTENGWTSDMLLECHTTNGRQDLGKILQVAGQGLSTIESFDPVSTSTKDMMGDLGQERQAHVAVPYDGKVLIAGGSGSDDRVAYNSALLFDIQTRTFTMIQHMISARSAAAAAQFGESAVVCGGFSEVDALNSCEQFIDGQWHSMPAMIMARLDFALLNVDDKLYAFGGYLDLFSSSIWNEMERYDPESGWTELDMWIPTKVSFGTVVFHENIILCGGLYYDITDFECDRYSPSQNTWFAFPTLRKARKDLTMISAFGTIYVFGGTDSFHDPVQTVEVYDTRSQLWHDLGFSAVTLSNRIRSAVVAVGAWRDIQAQEQEFMVKGEVITDVECYAYDNNIGTMICPKGNATATDTAAKNHCLGLVDSETRSVYLDGVCFVSFPHLKHNRMQANTVCTDRYGPNTHLAILTNERQVNITMEQMELSNGAWTAGTKGNNWGQTVDGKHAATNTAPLWAPGFPQDGAGGGILLRYDGMVNAQLSSYHPFMCQINYKKWQTEFVKLNGRASPTVGEPLISSTTGSVLELDLCAFWCHRDPKCKSFAHSSSQQQCLQYWLPTNDMVLIDDDDFWIFDKTMGASDCIEPTDCIPSEPPKLVLVKYGGVVSFESYHPGRSNLNSILYTTTQEKTNPVAVLLEGKIVITSHFHLGEAGEVPRAKDTIVYDPNTNTVSTGGSTIEARHEPAAAELDYAVIMCGGMSSTSVGLSSCERYADGQWGMLVAALNVPRWAFGMVNLHNKLYAIGGWNNAMITTVERYDVPPIDAWSVLKDPSPSTIHWPGVTVFGDQIVVCGGALGSLGPGNTAECHTYSDITDQWSTMAPMTKARAGFPMAAFHGFIYAFGDRNGDVSVEKFDPRTGQWSAESDTLQPNYAAAFVV